MNGDVCAVFVQPCHNSGADTPCGPGHEYDFAIHVLICHRFFLNFLHGHIHKDFTGDMQHDKPTLPLPDDISAAHARDVTRFIAERIDEAE